MNQNNTKEIEYIPLDDDQNYYYSFDLGIAAHLLSKDFELISLDKELKNKVMFIFKRNPEIEKEVKKYWDFKSTVDSQTYFNQLKRLKNQIHSSN